MAKKILVVQVAALGWELMKDAPQQAGLEFKATQTIFPAVTCPVQASMRTGAYPREHGMVMNGYYSRDLRKPAFWEQSSKLVKGERIWSDFQKRGKSVGMLFWQQSLGEQVDVLLSPWPIHKHHGGLVDITYSRPNYLYDEILQKLKKPFRLMYYWGPFAQYKASEWIAEATMEVMGMDIAPDLLFTYLPHLDYDLQKFKPGHKKCAKAVAGFLGLLQKLVDSAEANDYEILIYGDYAIGDVKNVLHPNRCLLEKGLMRVRPVQGMLYPNFHESSAFAVVDHEFAHVYIQRPEKLDAVVNALQSMEGEFEVLLGDEKAEHKVDHEQAGEIILKGAPGTWFAYPWWDDKRQAPDYATHIDIHNKPGYDPCELFSGWNPFKVSTNASLVKGSHGAVGLGREVAWASSFELGCEPADIVDLALALRQKLARV